MNRLVVFGYDELVLASLEAAVAAGADVAAVVFPSSRREPAARAVRSIVRREGHRVLEHPPRPREGRMTGVLEDLAPDLHLVWSYPMILPARWIEVPRAGSVNVHFGLLPEYRGAHGMCWALVNGEERTGVTLHYMDAGVDTGPIIDRARFPIDADDDLLSLLRMGRRAGSMLLEHWLARLIQGRVPSLEQDENRARHYPPRTVEDRRIDWTAGAVRVWNLVRSSPAPFPGAFTFLDGQRIVLRSVRPLEEGRSRPPGRVWDVSPEGARVGTGGGGVLVERVEVEGEEGDAEELGPPRFAAVGLAVGARFDDRRGDSSIDPDVPPRVR